MKEISTQQWFVNISDHKNPRRKPKSIVSKCVPYVPIAVLLTAESAAFLSLETISTSRWRYTYLCTSVYEEDDVICAVNRRQV